MNNKIRVMICDDSSIARRLVATTLNADLRLEVAFQASNGQEAVENIERIDPDILVCDVEMPVMDGIDTIRAIRDQNKQLPIVMFSSLTARGAEATLDALESGANDFVTKPSGSASAQVALNEIKANLIPKIYSLTSWKPRTSEATNTRPESSAVQRQSRSNTVIVGIGVSTGGPGALARLVEDLPSSPSAPVLITQHMPATFLESLAQRLDAQTELDVHVARQGERLAPGQILLAPGDRHLCIGRNGPSFVVELRDDPPSNSCRPAVDNMFCSIAENFGSRSLGIVLTGMGRDGTRGAGAIRSVGGSVIAQDKDTSIVWGMPGEVVDAGYANSVLPIQAIGLEIARRIARKALPDDLEQPELAATGALRGKEFRG